MTEPIEKITDETVVGYIENDKCGDRLGGSDQPIMFGDLIYEYRQALLSSAEKDARIKELEVHVDHLKADFGWGNSEYKRAFELDKTVASMTDKLRVAMELLNHSLTKLDENEACDCWEQVGQEVHHVIGICDLHKKYVELEDWKKIDL